MSLAAPSTPIKILHLSDLHFGRIEEHVLSDLERFLAAKENNFHLAILTGDLTQRAKKAQFIAAKQFLAKLNCPLFVVPGNHDVPLYNIFLRFFNPYFKFRRYFGSLSPEFYEDDRVVVYGLWTVNNHKVEEGRLSSRQVTALEAKFKSVPQDKLKIIAFHHPLVSMEKSKVQAGLQRVRKLHPHVMMWGHDHRSGARYWNEETSSGPLLVAAGTSVSNRTREESNSFNVLTLTEKVITVQTISY
ncbi:MAG: metallophosphoesterase, partial [Proteobacteria bacterium]